MPETAEWIGAFIRWIIKGCRTALRDEIEGNIEHEWHELEARASGRIFIIWQKNQ